MIFTGAPPLSTRPAVSNLAPANTPAHPPAQSQNHADVEPDPFSDIHESTQDEPLSIDPGAMFDTISDRDKLDHAEYEINEHERSKAQPSNSRPVARTNKSAAWAWPRLVPKKQAGSIRSMQMKQKEEAPKELENAAPIVSTSAQEETTPEDAAPQEVRNSGDIASPRRRSSASSTSTAEDQGMKPS